MSMTSSSSSWMITRSAACSSLSRSATCSSLSSPDSTSSHALVSAHEHRRRRVTVFDSSLDSETSNKVQEMRAFLNILPLAFEVEASGQHGLECYRSFKKSNIRLKIGPYKDLVLIHLRVHSGTQYEKIGISFTSVHWGVLKRIAPRIDKDIIQLERDSRRQCERRKYKLIKNRSVFAGKKKNEVFLVFQDMNDDERGLVIPVRMWDELKECMHPVDQIVMKLHQLLPHLK